MQQLGKRRLTFALALLALPVLGLGVYNYFTETKVSCMRNPGPDAHVPDHSSAAAAGVQPIAIPRPSDWVDYGRILEAGPEDAWDFLWGGITPASIVKKNGTYYFYYVAGDGYRSHDGEERHRSIGVATSPDGIHFSKYSGNPIMRHSPLHGEEEGANSAGITLNAEGEFVMYYGAAIGPRDLINADGRVAISSDGFHFTDITMVLDHRPRRGHHFLPWYWFASRLYGYGDEIFPVATFQHQGNWYVYYQANGGTAPRTLGMAWGPGFNRLSCSVKVLDETGGGKPVGTWGNVIWLGPDTIALFIQRRWWPETFVEVRTASPDAPHRLSEPIERYDIPNLKRGAVFLDRERRTWFMYYNDFDRFWDVKLAPAGAPDATPPTAPADLSATAVSHDRAKLAWKAAADPDPGVVIYNIYRNGAKVGSTKDWTFTASGMSELSRYTYSVTAVNFHGTEGPPAQVTVSTPADSTPPTLISVTSSVDPTQVTVLFSEPVDTVSAENTANYTIDNGVRVTAASLAWDFRTVALTTSDHIDNLTYLLTVNRVLDRAARPNRIASDTRASYTHSAIAGLVGYWNFDQGEGQRVADVSGYGNDGLVHGARWRDGLSNGALWLDGKSDYVLVHNRPPLSTVTDGSFTFAAWANPEALPSHVNGYGILLRAGSHPDSFFGLSYTAKGQFQAQLIDALTQSPITLSSAPTEAGEWSHVVMVVEAAAKRLHLYVDGKAVAASPKQYTGVLLELNQEVGKDYRAGEYYIGSTKPDLGAGSFFVRHFKGMFDEVRIYNRDLSPDEVRALSDPPAGIHTPFPPLVPSTRQ